MCSLATWIVSVTRVQSFFANGINHTWFGNEFFHLLHLAATHVFTVFYHLPLYFGLRPLVYLLFKMAGVLTQLYAGENILPKHSVACRTYTNNFLFKLVKSLPFPLTAVTGDFTILLEPPLSLLLYSPMVSSIFSVSR